MESIDDLLAQVKAEYLGTDKTQQLQKKSLFEEEEFKSPSPVQPTDQYQPSPPISLSNTEESLLAELKAEFAEQERLKEIHQQQQLQEEQRRQEKQRQEEQLRVQQQEQRRKEALTQQATTWLKNLNPHSEEGLWFEEFSYSYPSQLEAAIDYLQALKETP